MAGGGLIFTWAPLIVFVCYKISDFSIYIFDSDLVWQMQLMIIKG